MQGVDPQQKAEIIDHIYDVALDPARFEQLLDVWERRIGPLRHQTGEGEQADLLASDPDIVQHASRASEFLSRMREPDEPSWPRQPRRLQLFTSAESRVNERKW